MTYQNYPSVNGYSNNTAFFVGSTGEDDWKIWNKPIDCKLVYITAVGGGGGGSGGTAAASGSLGSGGTGGGPARYLTTCIPSLFLPDTLYIKVGLGGSGGVGGVLSTATSPTGGGDGGTTFVSVFPDTSPGNIICAALGGSGAPAVTTSNNVSMRALVVSSTPFIRLGLNYLSVSSFITWGARGSISGSDNPDSNYYGTEYTMGGAGGGAAGSSSSIGAAGGSIKNYWNINNYDSLPITIAGGAKTTSATQNGNNGINGNFSNESFFNRLNEYMFVANAGTHAPTGGLGGGPAYGANVTGGKGGNGGLGCGGGGGGGVGSATGSSFGGAGGNGGAGWVVIIPIT